MLDILIKKQHKSHGFIVSPLFLPVCVQNLKCAHAPELEEESRIADGQDGKLQNAEIHVQLILASDSLLQLFVVLGFLQMSKGGWRRREKTKQNPSSHCI